MASASPGSCCGRIGVVQARKPQHQAHGVSPGNTGHNETILCGGDALSALGALPVARVPGQLPHPWENEWDSV